MDYQDEIERINAAHVQRLSTHAAMLAAFGDPAQAAITFAIAAWIAGDLASSAAAFGVIQPDGGGNLDYRLRMAAKACAAA